jgi:hypothetical protein
MPGFFAVRPKCAPRPPVLAGGMCGWFVPHTVMVVGRRENINHFEYDYGLKLGANLNI